MRGLLVFSLLLLCGAFKGSVTTVSTPADVSVRSGSMNELIVLAAPATNDPYYSTVAGDIFDFHVAYARQIANHDRVLVLTDEKSYSRYAAALGEGRVAVAPMADIWARDYGLSNASDPTMFRYTAAGQGGGARGQGDAGEVQGQFAALAEAAHLRFRNRTQPATTSGLPRENVPPDGSLAQHEIRRLARRGARRAARAHSCRAERFFGAMTWRQTMRTRTTRTGRR